MQIQTPYHKEKQIFFVKQRNYLAMLWLLLLISICTFPPPIMAIPSVFSIEKTQFGRLPDGTEINEFSIEGKHIALSVINYGGIISRLSVPDKHNQIADIVLGYDQFADYLYKNRFFGAIIGRVANRVNKGSLLIGDDRHQLDVNKLPHHLHGGVQGFDKVYWHAQPFIKSASAGVVLTHSSEDGHAGYPGQLMVTVTYTLTEAGELVIEYQATSDTKTVFSPTQHSYFNLAGSGNQTIGDHQLTVFADDYLLVDSQGIPSGMLASVKNTVFDFTTAIPLNSLFDNMPIALQATKGLDHFWVSQRQRGELTKVARLYHPTSGRVMEVKTTEVGAQIYSANYLNPSVIGKHGISYQKHAGICIETGHYIDTSNNQLPTIYVTPEKPYYSKTVFAFSVEK